MLWFLASALAWCNHTECVQIAEWLEYTPFPLADERSVRLCVANMVDHTLSMSSGECPNEDVYTCFDCAPSDAFKAAARKNAAAATLAGAVRVLPPGLHSTSTPERVSGRPLEGATRKSSQS